MKHDRKIWCGGYETEQLIEKRLMNIGCVWVHGVPDLSGKHELALYLRPYGDIVRLLYSHGFRYIFNEVEAAEIHFNDLAESLVKTICEEKAGDTIGF